ncbi:MAG: ribonuclease III [Myxococcales bacterium]|nr:ribonuclease III [Myxococcales bacterium]
MDSDREAYAALEALLGHRFANPGLLERALTHKSFLNENQAAVATGREDNERLEFLGDAVIALAIGHLLMESFPLRSEGELSKTRAQIVSEPGLAEVAQGLGLGEWLFLGKGEEQTGGRRKPSLLADGCEAVLAAVYLDGGFPASLQVARNLFGAVVQAAQEVGGSDYKTRLQERAQGDLRVPARYAVIATTGPDHDRTFEVALHLGEREYARATGKSKKEAEQRAAERALAVLDLEAAVGA